MADGDTEVKDGGAGDDVRVGNGAAGDGGDDGVGSARETVGDLGLSFVDGGEGGREAVEEGELEALLVVLVVEGELDGGALREAVSGEGEAGELADGGCVGGGWAALDEAG